MTELERALVALGRELDVPVTPALVPAVRVRIGRSRARWLLPAVAVVILAVAAAFAVPQARTAILRFFHIGAVRVERVGTLPRANVTRLTAGLGSVRSRSAAEHVAGFSAQLGEIAAPSRWWARQRILATIIPPDGILLVELAGNDVGAAKKLVDPEARVVPTNVGGSFALWIAGRHVLVLSDSAVVRYAGNALVWTRGGRTFRLEGEPSLKAAIRDAKAITP
jgi:hypothetical protein